MLSVTEFAVRLTLAFVLGAAIGIERQWRQKSAGLRTNTLVSIGAAAFILLSVSITGHSGDPSRVAAQIVSGIGFLGAGVIMKDGLNVQGLNTAATLWCAAAVGALVGIGLFPQAILTTVTVIITHLLLRTVGTKLSVLTFIPKNTSLPADYKIIINCKNNVENHIRVLLIQQLGNNEKIVLRSLASSDNENQTSTLIVAEITAAGIQDYIMEQMVSRLTIEQEVTKVSWEFTGQQAEI
ncbi:MULTISPECIES: MgtC/SapB family protein [unclassified Flavobacterium]|uniref:MgtC/SapB family protein n=1 Tax=unclassified Flavobacterium TaxID=196869 RepID=UPI00095AAA46|nr:MULTISPECIES: MgtC/SapB family protein [unclassified Flavobacterium]MBN9286139.1 MgtC/SapB family protein [Flavobacterium sp.]OJV68339.1 MAG: magnesium transporter MgtC [Flavobacterium sp. 40-81]